MLLIARLAIRLYDTKPFNRLLNYFHVLSMKYIIFFVVYFNSSFIYITISNIICAICILIKDELLRVCFEQFNHRKHQLLLAISLYESLI